MGDKCRVEKRGIKSIIHQQQKTEERSIMKKLLLALALITVPAFAQGGAVSSIEQGSLTGPVSLAYNKVTLISLGTFSVPYGSSGVLLQATVTIYRVDNEGSQYQSASIMFNDSSGTSYPSYSLRAYSTSNRTRVGLYRGDTFLCETSVTFWAVDIVTGLMELVPGTLARDGMLTATMLKK